MVVDTRCVFITTLAAPVFQAFTVLILHRDKDHALDQEKFPFQEVPNSNVLLFFNLSRNCIGMNFAMAEMKVAVAMILRRSVLRLCLHYNG